MFAFRVLDPKFGSHPYIHWISLRIPVWVPPSSPLWFDDRPRPRIPPSSTRTLDIWAPRTRPYHEFNFLLIWSWSLFLSSILVCLLLLRLPWYLFRLLVLGSCIFFQHWYWFILRSFRLMSPSAGLVLVPLFSDPILNTRCGGIYSLISLFRIAASSTPHFWSFGMNFVIIRRPPCGLHIRLSRVGWCDVEYIK